MLTKYLKSSSKSATSGRSLRLWRNSLVISEVALSLILLVGAGLMIKSFAQLTNVPPGFDPNGVLTGRISMTSEAYAKPEQCVVYVNQVLAKLRALPGWKAPRLSHRCLLAGVTSAPIFESKADQRQTLERNQMRAIEV